MLYTFGWQEKMTLNLRKLILLDVNFSTEENFKLYIES